MDILAACLTVARHNAEHAAQAEHLAERNRLRKAAKADFYLRILSRGYDWTNADPDGILPTQHPREPK